MHLVRADRAQTRALEIDALRDAILGQDHGIVQIPALAETASPPDVFARMHAATKPATLGLALVLGGAALVMDRT